MSWYILYHFSTLNYDRVLGFNMLILYRPNYLEKNTRLYSHIHDFLTMRWSKFIPRKTRIYLYYTVITVTADALATQVARPSAAMLLAKFSGIFCPHHQKILNLLCQYHTHWWPGHARRQDINTHGIVLFFPRILTLNTRGPSYLGLTRSISWLLMPGLLTSPGHQQPWYWLYKICRSCSYLRKDFKYLCQINVEEWHKM